MEIFKDYAYYYNLFYGNKDYKGEAKVVEQLLKRYENNTKITSCDNLSLISPIETILNIGCGTGRHDIELAKLGYKVTGIDLSEEMIEIANANKVGTLETQYEVGDARTYRTNQTYDAVISLFHVMSYQNSNDDILQSFQTVAKVLPQDALFLFDVWYGPGVLTDKPAVRTTEMEDHINKIVRIANPVMHVDKNIVDVNYQVLIMNKETNVVEEIKEKHSMRYYFEPEIEKYLELSDMELVACVDCETLQKPTLDSWTAYFIARKNRSISGHMRVQKKETGRN